MFVKAGFLGITKIPWLVFGLAYDRILVGFSVELRNVTIVAAGTIYVFAGKIISLAIMTHIQVETPPELIGKILSVLMILPSIGQSIGYPLQGWLFQQFSTTPWYVVFGAVFVTIFMSVYKYRQFKNIGRAGNATE